MTWGKMLDILERLDNDEMYVDAADDAIHEIEQLRVIVGELISALRLQANNLYLNESPCWCRHADWTIGPTCEDQSQCVTARAALAKAQEAK